MDLHLSDEHRMIRDMARDFAQKEIAPVADRARRRPLRRDGRVPLRDDYEDGRTGLYGH